MSEVVLKLSARIALIFAQPLFLAWHHSRRQNSLFIAITRSQLSVRPKDGPPMNAINPDQTTAAERLHEIAEILAAGLTRLRSRQSSALPADFGESSLDCVAPQSGAANILTDGGSN